MIMYILCSLIDRYFEFRLKSNLALWTEINDYLKRTESTGAKYATLFYIYKHIKTKSPRNIVECGTGLSTIVICHAIREIQVQDKSYKPRFVSMESEEFYWQHALEILPENCKGLVDIRLSSLSEDTFSLFRGVRYTYLVKGEVNFLFIDGPSYTTNNGGQSFCFDALSYIKTSDIPISAVIDTRVSTVYVLQKLLGRKKVTFSPFTRVGFIDRASKYDLRLISEPPSKHFHISLNRNIELDVKPHQVRPSK